MRPEEAYARECEAEGTTTEDQPRQARSFFIDAGRCPRGIAYQPVLRFHEQTRSQRSPMARGSLLVKPLAQVHSMLEPHFQGGKHAGPAHTVTEGALRPRGSDAPGAFGDRDLGA